MVPHRHRRARLDDRGHSAQFVCRCGVKISINCVPPPRRKISAVPLQAKTGETKAAIRRVEQYNIAGVVPGTDPKLKDEVVIYSAHWDHLGKGTVQTRL